MSSLTGRSALEEYKDPIDQLSAAITNAIIPTNSNFVLGESISTNCGVREGSINMTKPVEPITAPSTVYFLRLSPYNIFPSSNTQIGTVENKSAVTLDERYCSPHVNSPCPPCINAAPIIIVPFHFLLLSIDTSLIRRLIWVS